MKNARKNTKNGWINIKNVHNKSLLIPENIISLENRKRNSAEAIKQVSLKKHAHLKLGERTNAGIMLQSLGEKDVVKRTYDFLSLVLPENAISSGNKNGITIESMDQKMQMELTPDIVTSTSM